MLLLGIEMAILRRWLFADRTAHNYSVQRGWVNVFKDLSGHNILEKIKRHEKSHMKWKSVKVLDEENEKDIRHTLEYGGKESLL